MSFAAELATLPWRALLERAAGASVEAVRASLAAPAPGLADFAGWISPAGAELLPELADRSRAVTLRRFGRVIRLFAPLYLSNECINTCSYCGFSRDKAIVRVTLGIEEVRQEAQALMSQGFRNLLLVAGEHPRFIPAGYLAACVAALHEQVPSLSLEVGPMETAEYRPIVAAGAEGLVVYQETYDPDLYRELHTAGPKRDFLWRLETPERAYAAGFRRLGIGALLGLGDWRREAICLAAHAAHLLRHCWKAAVTVSVPRLRPCAGEFQPRAPVPDRELAQLVCALRLFLPDAGLVLSTREPARLRDGMIPLGITLMSAGSHTEPGGYTGAGRAHLHQTVRGRPLEATSGLPASLPAAHGLTAATVQFEIADHRSPAEVGRVLRKLGYEAVWKDWDLALSA